MDLHMEKVVSQLEQALVLLVQEELRLPVERMLSQLGLVVVVLVSLVQGELWLHMARMVCQLGLVLV